MNYVFEKDHLSQLFYIPNHYFFAHDVSKLLSLLFLYCFVELHLKVSKGAKIRTRYNQVPHLTQDTNGKVTNSQLDTTNEGQEGQPFPSLFICSLVLVQPRETHLDMTENCRQGRKESKQTK